MLPVEQNVMQSLSVASQASVIEQGDLVMKGNAAGMLADPKLRRAYLGL